MAGTLANALLYVPDSRVYTLHTHTPRFCIPHVPHVPQQEPAVEGLESIRNNCTMIICAQQSCETVGMTANEAVAYGKLKTFCSNIIKRLAPPLLKEV